MDNMPEVKARLGDDPAYRDYAKVPIVGDLEVVKKYESGAFKWLQEFDRATASGIAMGAYRKKMEELGLPVDFSHPNKEAIEYAQMIVRKTQASPLFKDIPPSLRGGLTGSKSLDKIINQFQTFMLSRWDNVVNYAIRANILGGRGVDKKDPDFRRAFTALSFLIISILAGMAIRKGVKKVERSAVGLVTGGNVPEPEDDLPKEFILEAASTVPFVSQAISVGAYGGNFVPALGGVVDVAEGSYRAVTAEKPEGRKSGAIKALTGAGELAGVAGTGQASKLARMNEKANSKSGAVDLYYKAWRNKDKSLVEKADRLAVKEGILIKDAKAQAYARVKKEVADMLERAYLEKDRRLVDEAERIANGNKKLISQGKSTVMKRLKNKRLKEKGLEAQEKAFSSN
jgi:hypothetical protein